MNKFKTMKSALEQLKEKLLKDKAYKKEINKKDLSFEIAESIVDARIKKGMTQKELAKKAGTKQSGIARLESGRNYPSLKNLETIAKILDIEIRNPLFVEKEVEVVEKKVDSVFTVPANWFAKFTNLKSAASLDMIVEQNVVKEASMIHHSNKK